MPLCCCKVIVGILQAESSKNLYLFPTDYLDKVNHRTNTQIFDIAIRALWPNKIKYDNICLIISDMPSNIKKAGRSIKLCTRILCI